jgi:hypothetical protein
MMRKTVFTLFPMIDKEFVSMAALRGALAAGGFRNEVDSSDPRRARLSHAHLLASSQRFASTYSRLVESCQLAV